MTKDERPKLDKKDIKKFRRYLVFEIAHIVLGILVIAFGGLFFYLTFTTPSKDLFSTVGHIVIFIGSISAMAGGFFMIFDPMMFGKEFWKL